MERSVQRRLCTIIFYAVVLILSTVSSQSCTTETLDPRNVNDYDPSRLVPLFRQHPETFSIGGEQWIFPDLQFTCYGVVTKWIFAGVPGQPATRCRVGLEIWRPDTTSTIYRQIRTTESNNIVTIVEDGQTFTYELAWPVPVEPGDIVGVELGRFCAPLEDLDNVLSLNISGTTSSYLSYRKAGSEPTFFLRSSSITPEQDFVPLIEPVVEPLREVIGSIEIRTQSKATTAPEDNQSDSSSISTIVSATFGGVIGVLITVIVCVCVWCITRRVRIQVSINKERETESVTNTNKHQQNRQPQQEQQDESTNNNMISMQRNKAYKSIHLTGTTQQTDYHTGTDIWVPEQAVQLNVAYGKRNERSMTKEIKETTGIPQAVQPNVVYGKREEQRHTGIERQETPEIPDKHAVRTNPAYGQGGGGIETEEIGDDSEYERMYAAVATGHAHAIPRQNTRELGNCSHFVTPREYEVPVRQQGSHTFTQEDNEYQYDYIL